MTDITQSYLKNIAYGHIFRKPPFSPTLFSYQLGKCQTSDSSRRQAYYKLSHNFSLHIACKSHAIPEHIRRAFTRIRLVHINLEWRLIDGLVNFFSR